VNYHGRITSCLESMVLSTSDMSIFSFWSVFTGSCFSWLDLLRRASRVSMEGVVTNTWTEESSDDVNEVVDIDQSEYN
jgi:hypothetical protein